MSSEISSKTAKPYVSITHAYDDAGDSVGNFNSGETVDDTTPTLFGQTVPNGYVRIYVDNYAKGYVTADASGNWSFTLSELSSGAHTIKAELLDGWAKVAVSEKFIINVGVAAPAITSVLDDAGVVTGQLGQNGWTDDTRPEMTGTAAAGHVVNIYDGAKLLGSTVADPSGVWRFTPPSDLGVGVHSLVAQAQDASGNLSSMSSPWAITVVAAPSITHGYDSEGRIVGNFASGKPVDDVNPTLHGKAAPNGVVKVYVDNVWQGDATADASGNWSYKLSGLSEGSHTVSVELMNGSTLVSKSNDFVILVDTTAPDSPTLNTLPSAINENPTLGGTGTPGTTVVIRDNGTEIGSVVVREDGTWSFTPNPALSEGEHRLTAESVDTAGNASAPSAPQDVVIDTIAPDTPTFNELPTATNENPTLSGSGAPGETIVIRDNGEEIGRVEVGKDGTWSFTPSPALGEGEHSLSVEAVDKAGNISTPSAPQDVVIDTELPDTPAFNELPGATNENPTLSGSGTPGETIVIRDNGEEIGRVEVGEDGTWSFTPNPALGEGEHSLAAEAVDKAGNVSAPSEPQDVVIDTIAPDTPTFNALPGATNQNPTLTGSGAAGETIVIRDKGREIGSVVVREDGTWSFAPNPALEEGEHSLTVQAVDKAGNSSEISNSQSVVVDTTAPNAPTIADLPEFSRENPILDGSGPAGETIVIRDKGREIGSVVVREDGAWSFIPNPALSEGEHSLTAEAVDKAGNASLPSAPQVIVIDTTAPEQPVLDLVDFTNDTTPTLGGSGLQAGERVIVHDNGFEIGFAIVDAGGSWSFTPTKPMDEGEHPITIVVVDRAGNASVPSLPEVVIIDITPPDQPILNLVDITSNTKPTLTGGGLQPGEQVIIRDNGVQIGSTIAGPDGNWSYTPTKSMTEGNHPITIVVVDKAGNASVPSDVEVLLVDTTAPTQRATMTYVGKDNGFSHSDMSTNDGSAGRLMQGTLTATLATHEKLQISTDGGVTWLDAIVNGKNWAAQDHVSHSGSWTVETRVIDALGRVGTKDSFSITLDASAPTAPSSVSISGKNVIVNLLPGAVAGDKVLVVADGSRVEYVLQATDITAKKATIALAALTTTARVSIEDSAGNVSAVVEAPQVSYFDSLSGYDRQSGTFQLDGMKFTAGPTIGVGLKNWAGAVNGGSDAIYIGSTTGKNSGTVLVELNRAATKVSISTLSNCEYGKVYFEFYDASGNVVGRCDPPNSNYTGITFTADARGPASYFKIVVAEESYGFYFGIVTADFVPLAHSTSTHEIVKGFSYVGSDASDTFLVKDTSVFTGFTGSIEGGKGTDTLKLMGAGQLLDLSALGNKMSSVEVVDITGTGDNTLKLSLGDVLGQGSMDLFHANGDVQMMVKGNAGDVVMLDDVLPNGMDLGDWSIAGTVDVGGVSYTSYQYSTMHAELLVQQGVQVNLV
jgi:hypothetical protein